MNIQVVGKAVSPWRGFVGTVATYGVGQVSMKVLDLLAFALLVRTLTVHELGFVGTMMLIGFWVTDLASLGLLRIAVPRFVLDADRESNEVLRNGLGAWLAYAVLAAALCIPGGWFLAHSLGPGYVAPFALYASSYLMRALVYMELEVLRMQGKAMLQAGLEALPSLLNLGSLLVLLPAMPFDLLASGWSQVIAWSPLFLWMAGRGLARGRPRLNLVPEMLRYSAPLVMQRSMSEIDRMSGRWIALIVFALPGAAAYTFLSRIGEVVFMALAPLQKAWLPVLLRSARHAERERVGQIAIAYMVISTAILVGFMCTYEDLERIIDAKGLYADYHAAAPLVAIAAWLSTYYLVFGVGFLVAKKPGRLIPISMAAAGINLFGGWLLGSTHGLNAMPYATIASSAFFSIATQWLSRKYFSFEYRPTWRVAGITLIVGGGVLALELAGWWPHTHFVAGT